MMKCHYETLYGNFLQRSFVEANYTVNKKRTFNHGIDLPVFVKKLKLRKLLLYKLVHLPKYTKDYNLATFCGATSSLIFLTDFF